MSRSVSIANHQSPTAFFASANLADSFAGLFSGLSVAALFLAAAGIMLAAVEMFRPARWRFAFAGGVLIFAGVVLRMLNRGTVGILFWMLLLVAAALLSFHIAALLLHKRAWLAHSKDLMLSEEAADPESHEFLVGLTGLSVTDINGSGNMVINDITFLVFSDRFIERGVLLRVVAVEGERIVVQRITNN
ncbi:MAG: hypothetical protein FWD58_09590 [Firmicutes bacterium]|nr:hypothetical protein [Bacillota bacterium]